MTFQSSLCKNHRPSQPKSKAACQLLLGLDEPSSRRFLLVCVIKAWWVETTSIRVYQFPCYQGPHLCLIVTCPQTAEAYSLQASSQPTLVHPRNSMAGKSWHGGCFPFFHLSVHGYECEHCYFLKLHLSNASIGMAADKCSIDPPPMLNF